MIRWVASVARGVVLAMLFTMNAYAQDTQVPNLFGLNVPQAAAALNAAGLRLGTQTFQLRTPQDNQPSGVVLGQSVAAGELIASGETVNITVLQAANVRLVYDDNDLTLINETGGALDLRTFTFRNADGTRQLQAARWRRSLPSGDCGQIWSVPRGDSKAIDGCDSIYWQSTNNSALHFWTPSAGGEQFSVLQNDAVIASCPLALPNSQDNPSVCAFFVNVGRAIPTTEYVYYAYTADRFTVFNVSEDQWMPIGATLISVGNLELNLGAAALFGNPDIVANVRRLAPGQCTMLTTESVTDSETPQDCALIAQVALTTERVFWTQEFSVRAATRDNEMNTCPAATPDFVTLCIVPR